MKKPLHAQGPVPPRAPNWIDALAYRAELIVGWSGNGEEFWVRLANATFVNTLLLRLLWAQPEPSRLLAPPDQLTQLSIEHAADRLEAVYLEEFAGLGAALDWLGLGLKTWTEIHAHFPRSLSPVATEGCDARGRWLVTLAAWCGHAVADRNPDWTEALRASFDKFSEPDRFLCSRLIFWSLPAWPNPASVHPVEDLIRYIYGLCSLSARLYSNLAIHDPLIVDGLVINWDLTAWTLAGWRAGAHAETLHALPALIDEEPPENVKFTRTLAARLEHTPEGQVAQPVLLGGCARHLAERYHQLIADTCAVAPFLCVRAFDYGLWMRLVEEGRLPVEKASHAAP